MKAVGAVHNSKVYEALMSYLHTPGAPFKNRIISLLTQLLLSPSLFQFPPDISKLDRLQPAVVRVLDSLAGTTSIICSNIQALIETIITAHQFDPLRRALHHPSSIFENMNLLVPMTDMFQDKENLTGKYDRILEMGFHIHRSVEHIDIELTPFCFSSLVKLLPL